MLKVKDLLKTAPNSVFSTNWSDVLSVLSISYRNKIFFNQSHFGANKNAFEKIRNGYIFNFEERSSSQ
jgi:hypothetical protein